MICLSVLSEGQMEILNMSNNAGGPMYTSFVLISSHRPTVFC